MSEASPPPFQLISSLRYDPILPEVVSQQPALAYPDPLRTPYYLLPYHLDRLTNAARHFCWHNALRLLEQDLTTFLALLDGFIPDRTRPWRLRIVIEDKAVGGLNVEVNPTAPVEEPRLFVLPFTTTTTTTTNSVQEVWRVYVDSRPTIPSAFTTHKTTAREYYTAARHRAGIMSPQEHAEVLVVNRPERSWRGVSLRRISDEGPLAVAVWNGSRRRCRVVGMPVRPDDMRWPRDSAQNR